MDQIQDDGRLDSAGKKIIAEATREELGVLMQELVPYMEARSQQYKDPVVREKIIAGRNAAIENALGKVIPEYIKAKRNLMLARKALDTTTHNAKFLHEQFGISAPSAYHKPRFINLSQFDPDK